MIDWLWVGSNTLWILGLAVLLAVGSYSNYRHVHRRLSPSKKRRPRNRSESFEVDKGILLRIGGLLVCLGLAASGASWMEQALWAIVAFALLVDTLVSVGRRLASPD